MKIVVLLVGFILASAQFVISQNHSSCDKAVLVDTSVYGPVYADGKPNPLLAMLHTDGTYFEKPHTVVWFCIDIPYDTILTFDLIPQNHSDDLDFLLFKDESSENKNCGLCRVDKKNFCQRISAEKIIPIRTNIANTSMSVKGMTGLSANAQNETELPGKHSTYSKALEVKKGERYYLVVDNYTYANRPFTLVLHFHFSEEDIGTASINNKISSPIAVKGPFQINVIDSLSGASVKAKIRITWINPGNRPRIETTAKTYTLPLKKGEKINIVCYTKGYLIAQKTYVAQTDSDKGIEIKLLQIREHMKMTFKHIQFVADKPEFLPSAMESLNDLLEFMNSNTDVKILIKGYVNDPHGTNQSMFDLDLSKRRAEAVYNYLVENSITKSRVQWMGCSNKDMIYADPVNLDEMEANRRVEVEIIK